MRAWGSVDALAGRSGKAGRTPVIALPVALLAVACWVVYRLALRCPAQAAALATASTLALAVATVVLAWQTMRLAETGDRQRKAMIRPYVELRSDFRPEPRSATPSPAGAGQEGNAATGASGRERCPGAKLLNLGTGVAINVRAQYRTSNGWQACQEIAAGSLAGDAPHWTEEWYDYLRKQWPQQVIILYEDTAKTRYYSRCVYQDGREKWDTGEGPGPKDSPFRGRAGKAGA